MYCSLFAVPEDEVAGLKTQPERIENMMTGRRSKGLPMLSLEKAWHGLHYLLTGSAMEGAGPEGFILEGGEEIGDDLGYGPARLFNPTEVQQIYATLSAISNEQLWERFDPADMEENGVYPGVWDEDEEDLQEEYLGYFQELKNFLRGLCENKQALLMVLN
jgi:hypothetical protein